jgi:hypothetical protein
LSKVLTALRKSRRFGGSSDVRSVGRNKYILTAVPGKRSLVVGLAGSNGTPLGSKASLGYRASCSRCEWREAWWKDTRSVAREIRWTWLCVDYVGGLKFYVDT